MIPSRAARRALRQTTSSQTTSHTLVSRYGSTAATQAVRDHFTARFTASTGDPPVDFGPLPGLVPLLPGGPARPTLASSGPRRSSTDFSMILLPFLLNSPGSSKTLHSFGRPVGRFMAGSPSCFGCVRYIAQACAQESYGLNDQTVLPQLDLTQAFDSIRINAVLSSTSSFSTKNGLFLRPLAHSKALPTAPFCLAGFSLLCLTRSRTVGGRLASARPSLPAASRFGVFGSWTTRYASSGTSLSPVVSAHLSLSSLANSGSR